MRLGSGSLIFFNQTEIDHIIALCHIINKYESFYQRLKDISPSMDYKFFQGLETISKGKKRTVSKKVKGFYNSNKDIIDTINKYSNFQTFISSNYIIGGKGKWKGIYTEKEEFTLIKDYILKNKSQIDKIIAILEKLKKLGFTELYFDEALDFTNDNYYVPLNERVPVDIDFLNNITIIPQYKSNVISYKTNNSPYLISARVSFNYRFGDILNQRILLNNLTFDPKELPDSISKKSTFDSIVELYKQKEQITSAITTSVDLRVGINDLVDAYQKLDEVITRIKNGDTEVSSSRQDIKEIYLQIGNSIAELQKIGADFDASATLKYPEISQEKLNSEVRRYLKIREDAKIHWN